MPHARALIPVLGHVRVLRESPADPRRRLVEEDDGRVLGAAAYEELFGPHAEGVVAMTDNDTPIICNGFKDAEFIEMAMLAQKIGRKIIPVVEKYTELQLIMHYAQKVGVRPQFGMRVKLAAKSTGRWQGSGGYRSKFGLTTAEIVAVVE